MARALPILPAVASAAPAPSLPTVQALEALWEEVAARPLWAPPRFFRYLALRARTRTRLLDPARVPVSAPAGKVNDCSTCTDLCCVGPRATVLLGLRDIAALRDVGRTDLMTHVKPAFDAATLRARPALRRHIASRAWRVFPVLRQDSMGACAALRREDGRCSLYPAWPLACARFPYALHGSDHDVFYSRRCQSFWVHPGARGRATAMANAAVAAYNGRIKDWVLLAYAPAQLAALGLLAHLHGGGAASGVSSRG